MVYTDCVRSWASRLACHNCSPKTSISQPALMSKKLHWQHSYFPGNPLELLLPPTVAKMHVLVMCSAAVVLCSETLNCRRLNNIEDQWPLRSRQSGCGVWPYSPFISQPIWRVGLKSWTSLGQHPGNDGEEEDIKCVVIHLSKWPWQCSFFGIISQPALMSGILHENFNRILLIEYWVVIVLPNHDHYSKSILFHLQLFQCLVPFQRLIPRFCKNHAHIPSPNQT